MFSPTELVAIGVFIAIFFVIMWLYIRHRIWQKSQILENAPPFPPGRSEFVGSRNQLQYPNARRIPSYFGSTPSVSDGTAARQSFARRYQGRPYSLYNTSLRPPPPSLMVFTVSIPEEEEDQGPPSYDEVIKQNTPPPPPKY